MDNSNNSNNIRIPTVDSLDRMERFEEISHNSKTWAICCSKSDREAVKYIIQMSLCLLLMVFCFVKLMVSDEDKEVYIGLLSFIIGVILPSPELKKIKN